MNDLPVSVIFDILEDDRETAIKLCKALAGCRVYFPKDEIKTLEIHEEYKQLLKHGYNKDHAINYLAEVYEVTTDTIKKRLKRATI